jgi:hypothetical protein
MLPKMRKVVGDQVATTTTTMTTTAMTTNKMDMN